MQTMATSFTDMSHWTANSIIGAVQYTRVEFRHSGRGNPVSDSDNLQLDTVRILIDRVRAGDERARSELVDQIQSYVTQMADQNLAREVRPRVGPSDIVQQSMIQMVNGFDRFRGQTTREFFGWLNKIIQNQANLSRRDQTRQKRDIRRHQSLSTEAGKFHARTLEQAEATPQSQALAKERIELFHAALENLTDEHATVIRLRNLEQLSFDEIASKMDKSKNAVTKLWYRAVMKFEEQLREFDD